MMIPSCGLYRRYGAINVRLDLFAITTTIIALLLPITWTEQHPRLIEIPNRLIKLPHIDLIHTPSQ